MRYHKPIDFLMLNVSLLPLEKKLLNIIITDFVDEFHAYNPLDFISAYHFSMNLTHYNQLIKNDRKLSAATVANQIKDKNLAVCMPEGSEISLFTEFSVIDNTISFELNTACNQFFCTDDLFILSKDDHSSIKKKNTITMYEICMFSLCYPLSSLDSRKPFKPSPYEQNEKVSFSHSFEDLKLMFGKETYKNYFKSEFDRSILNKAIVDLNKQNLGFEVSINNETNDGSNKYHFEIEISDAEKYKLLLNL